MTEDWPDLRQQARNHHDNGAYLACYDLLSKIPGDKKSGEDKYLEVLSLARAHSNDLARKLFFDYQFDQSDSTDQLALRARIAKNLAADTDYHDTEKTTRAASIYFDVFDVNQDYYPLINAATLSFLAGDRSKAVEAAKRVVAMLSANEPDNYYAAATLAEAYYLLEDDDKASGMLRKALSFDPRKADLATTRKQICHILLARKACVAQIDFFKNPKVAFVSGHMVVNPGRPCKFSEDEVPAVEQAMKDYFRENHIGMIVCSLANGADLIAAKVALDMGLVLEGVLPYDSAEFVDACVRPAGPHWVALFERAMKEATRIRYASNNSLSGDSILYSYSTEYALGMARIHADLLETDLIQLSVWNSQSDTGIAGTGADMETGKAVADRQKVFPVTGKLDSISPVTNIDEEPALGRKKKFLAFADIKGFSKLNDPQIDRIVKTVYPQIDEIIQRYGDSCLLENTWGDALFISSTNAEDIAALCLEICALFKQYDQDSLALPHPLAIRFGLHCGFIMEYDSPPLKSMNLLGTHVNHAARLEPIAPLNSVFATSQYVAQLKLQASTTVAAEYAGIQPGPKGYGDIAVYLLRNV